MVRKSLLVPHVVLMSTMALALAGCSSSDDDDSGGTSGSNSAFNGTWVSDCVLVDEDFPEDGYEQEVLTINGATASIEDNSYTDTACAMLSPENEQFVINFSLAFPGGTTTTPQGEATHVDVTPTSVMLNGMPLSAEQMQQAMADGDFDTFFSIILVDNAMLFLGEDDGDTAETRATLLDPEGYTLQ